jgi:hypothetical protein
MFAAVRRYVRAQLCISDYAAPSEVAAKVAASPHARDYYMAGYYVRNIRKVVQDRAFKRAERDEDSVLAAVRTCFPQKLL